MRGDLGDRRFDWRLEKLPLSLCLGFLVVLENPKQFFLGDTGLSHLSSLSFSLSQRKKKRETEREMLLRVLLETVLATGIFFGLYGAADAVRFCFQIRFFFLSFFCCVVEVLVVATV